MLEIEEILRECYKLPIIVSACTTSANDVIKFQRETDAHAISTHFYVGDWVTYYRMLKRHMDHIKNSNKNFMGVRLFPIDSVSAKIVYYFK
jgi:hypothetical protein